MGDAFVQNKDMEKVGDYVENHLVPWMEGDIILMSVYPFLG